MSPIVIRIAAMLMMAFLASCATHLESSDWRYAYRNCPVSGQAYFRGIPLASGNEHVQAELFEPIDPANCIVYIVRSDKAGPKSAHAKVFLYHPENAPPPLPSDYWPLFGLNSLFSPCWSSRHTMETPHELRKAEIFTPDVYAMWELAPGSYILDASLNIAQPFARAFVTCTAGRATFWAVAAKYIITDKTTLNSLDEAEGKALVRQRLRSGGMQPGGPFSLGWIGRRECTTD